MATNRSRFHTELDENLESFATNFFFTMGGFSTILSFMTFYLLVKKSAFFPVGLRFLLLLLQVSFFLNDLLFCILFAPFLYPFVGGGFCSGILCLLGVRFHYGMFLWLLSIVLLCSCFVVLMFAKFQTLLHPWSRFKLSFSRRLMFYAYTFASMFIIPTLYLFSDTPIEIQENIVNGMGLDWIADGKVYSVINGCDRPIFTAFLTYSILGNIIVFGSITAILFVLILRIVITLLISQPRISHMSNHYRSVYRAKIKNTIAILIQMVSSFCLGVVPLCFMVATIGIGVRPETESLY